MRMNERKTQIFLCHSSRDKADVHRIAATLESDTISVWYDDWKIDFGDSISAAVDKGISTSDYLAIVLTPDSVTSKWVMHEWSAAYHREQRWGNIKVLPLLLKDCDVPPLLADRKYVDLRGSLFSKNLKTLARWIDNRGKASPQHLQPPSKALRSLSPRAHEPHADTLRSEPLVCVAHYDLRGGQWGSNEEAAQIVDEVAGIVSAKLIPVYPLALIEGTSTGTKFPFGEVSGHAGRGRAVIDLRVGNECEVSFADMVDAISHRMDYFEFVFPYAEAIGTIIERFMTKGLQPSYLRSSVARFKMKERTLQVEAGTEALAIRVTPDRFSYRPHLKEITKPDLFLSLVMTDMSLEAFEGSFDV